MSKCIETTAEQALRNRTLRDEIVSKHEVSSLFGTFCLEDGSGRVVLDSQKALDHVKYVINDMKRLTSVSKMVTKVCKYR